MLVYVALLVFVLALIGAFLHPISILLRLLNADNPGVETLLLRTKSFIADLLFWGLLSLLTLGALVIIRSRLSGRKAPEYLVRGSNNLALGKERNLSPMKMAVAITAYDEGAAIARVVEDFKAQEGVVEVIIVDNNSRDDTAAQAVAAGARVVRESRQGYGYACIRGLSDALKVPEATGVVLTEGDGTFSASDLKKFQAYIHQVDMVIGTRAVPGLVEPGSQMDHFFTWGNIVISGLLRLRFWNSQFLGAARLSDVGCTFRAIRREALERILPDLLIGGNHFSLHMIMVALAHRLSVVEVPITFRRRVGQSKGASRSVGQGLRVGFAMIWHIITYLPPKTPNATEPHRQSAGATEGASNQCSEVNIQLIEPGSTPPGLPSN